MRSVLSLLILALILAGPAAVGQASPDTVPVFDRTLAISKTYAAIQQYFAHWPDARIEPEQLDSVFQAFLARGLETEGRNEFTLLMLEFTSLMGNSQTWYYDPLWGSSVLRMGFDHQYLGDRWVVAKSVVDGIVPGDVVVSLEGRSPESWYEELEKYIPASGERARRRQFDGILRASLPEQVTVEVENRKGKVRTVEVDRTDLPPRPGEPDVATRWLVEDSVAYIQMTAFRSGFREQEAITHIRSYSEAPVLIFDIRGNRGGNTPVSLTRALMNRPYRWWTESSPIRVGLFDSYARVGRAPEVTKYFNEAQIVWSDRWEPPDPEAYDGELILLVDRYTEAAAEDFVVGFKDNGRATIIGETTAGSTGQPYVYNFPFGSILWVGAKRSYLPDGSPFEGVGIRPDVEVEFSRETRYRDDDPVLQQALEQARRLLAEPRTD